MIVSHFRIRRTSEKRFYLLIMALQVELVPVLSDNYAYLLIDSSSRTLRSPIIPPQHGV